MLNTRTLGNSALAAALFCSPAAAGVVVEVTLLGTVSSNQVGGAPLSAVNVGDPVLMRFEVDSGVFVDGAGLTTRGYAINPDTFGLGLLDGLAVEIQSPLGAGQTAYFVLRDDDLGPDGFFTSTSVDSQAGLPLSEAGSAGPLANDLSLDYGTSMLGSPDILEALGTCWGVGPQAEARTLEDGGARVMDIDFQALRLKALPAETYCTAGSSAAGRQATISSSGQASAYFGFGCSTPPAWYRRMATGCRTLAGAGTSNKVTDAVLLGPDRPRGRPRQGAARNRAGPN